MIRNRSFWSSLARSLSHKPKYFSLADQLLRLYFVTLVTLAIYKRKRQYEKRELYIARTQLNRVYQSNKDTKVENLKAKSRHILKFYFVAICERADKDGIFTWRLQLWI